MILALVLAAAISAAAFRARALSIDGALAAVVVGTIVFGMGGTAWAILLLAFFISSSALTRWRAAVKAAAGEEVAKGGRRDAVQVLANGGIATLLAALAALRPDLALFPAFAGAIAAATADTWATEVGLLSRGMPRLITTGRRVPAGTSGGVTPLGTAAALAGGVFIGALAAVLVHLGWATSSHSVGDVVAAASAATRADAGAAARIALVTPAAALLAALFDSLLGATVQAAYHCPRCDRTTERRVHRCGTRTTRTRGLAWIDNDAVNLAATAAGAVVGWWVG
ncbi:MAG TPA: DUF92 domain-containing protein [Longimicrobiales bacterium]